MFQGVKPYVSVMSWKSFRLKSKQHLKKQLMFLSVLTGRLNPTWSDYFSSKKSAQTGSLYIVLYLPKEFLQSLVISFKNSIGL